MTMSCLNRCLPNPKLLINFIYLLKEIQNVIFGLNKSFSEFSVLRYKWLTQTQTAIKQTTKIFKWIFANYHWFNTSCFTEFKTYFSFHNITPKTLKWLPYILNCHCLPLSPWFIILDKKIFVKVSHHYWIPIWAPMLEWQSGGEFFLMQRLLRDPQKLIFSI